MTSVVRLLVSETLRLTLKWLPRAIPLGLLSAALGATSTYADNMGYYFESPQPELYWGAFVTGCLVEVILVAALLRGMLRNEWRGLTGAQIGVDERNYFVSSIATMLIWFISVVIVLLPVIMCCLAVFAVSGVDLELLSSQDGWNEIALTPRYISMGIFVFGLIACIAVLARLAPYAAGAIDQRKVVAMEALKWTKGSTIALTLAQIIILAIVFVFAGAVSWVIYEISFRLNLLQDGVLMNLPLLTLESLLFLPFSVAMAAFSVAVYRTSK